MRSGRLLRIAAGAVLVLGLVLPVLAGLGQSLAAAFGHFPALGARGPDLSAWRALLAEPGLARAAALSLWTGLAATLLSLGVALGAVAALQGGPGLGRAGRMLAPVLAAPHAAMAIGLAFVLAPSGWIARGLAPLLGWDRPPDVATVGDPLGLALILGLAVKELPFLLAMAVAGLGQIPVAAHMAAGRSLGYGRAAIWLRILLPQLWPLIRLPVLVVLAFSVSVVDMAQILGPSTPPTLSVLVARLFSDPDPRAILPASAGGIMQLVLTGVAAALVLGGARLAGLRTRAALRRGRRMAGADRALGLPLALLAGLAGLAALALAAILLWSVTFAWRWPDPFPARLSAGAWQDAGRWGATALGTLGIAAACAAMALAAAVAWLEGADRLGRPQGDRWMTAALYLPLLLPQLSFLIGLAGMTLSLPLPPLAAVIWGHWLFVLPYVFIALAGPWRALDPRLARSAAALGAGPARRLWRVKLPVLAAPLALAAAIGFAVSVAQYLPTLLLGGGRIATLTTEAVALASGADRRVAAVHAVLQAALPWAGFLAALSLPALLHRNRRALRGAA
ncbi:ABC transporter permease [Mangrovicoccus algicola]|uniref:ABC transporter permease n=1 Tax=Mangrovicoccus algicola TaxID=2771008 RepID=A0A8J7CUD0_9RHOB|nr:ABC transporter permease [Mangrovicoccus algicola]MBE3637319.1 ABC transporter permease [Mangrovicoccus algicola]